jgi:hypothetical protein
MAPLPEDKKQALLERLKAGRAKIRAAREEAKAKGLPDPKPRKARKPKDKNSDGAIDNPASAPAANEKIAPIDGAPRDAVNAVGAKPVDPAITKTTPIDVPNLPGEGKEVESKKDIVKDAEAVPVAPPKKGLSSTGKPTKVNVNDELLNEATGNSVIPAQYPGQKESIKKMLKVDKKEVPLSNHEDPNPPAKTTSARVKHTPDVKAVEGRAPFSFSAMRKMLHQ